MFIEKGEIPYINTFGQVNVWTNEKIENLTIWIYYSFHFIFKTISFKMNTLYLTEIEVS